MKKLAFKEMMNISKALTKNETKLFYRFELETQRELYDLLKNNEEEFKQEFRTVALQFRDEEEVQKEEGKRNKQDTKMGDFFLTQGISNPSNVTKYAFEHQSMMANWNKFYNGFGMLTLNMEKQAQYNYYDMQQRQNMINIAQNDAIIKQNEETLKVEMDIRDQNEKLIEQNNQMIELMKQMANK